MITEALEESHYRTTIAARKLGMERSMLNRKIRALKIPWKNVKPPEEITDGTNQD